MDFCHSELLNTACYTTTLKVLLNQSNDFCQYCRNCHVLRANDHVFQTSAFELEIVQKDEHIELLKSSLEKNNENLQVLTNKLKDTVSAAACCCHCRHCTSVSATGQYCDINTHHNVQASRLYGV